MDDNDAFADIRARFALQPLFHDMDAEFLEMTRRVEHVTDSHCVAGCFDSGSHAHLPMHVTAHHISAMQRALPPPIVRPASVEAILRHAVVPVVGKGPQCATGYSIAVPPARTAAQRVPSQYANTACAAPNVRDGPLCPNRRDGPLCPNVRDGPLCPNRRDGPLCPNRRDGPLCPDGGRAVALAGNATRVARSTAAGKEEVREGLRSSLREINEADILRHERAATGALCVQHGALRELDEAERIGDEVLAILRKVPASTIAKRPLPGRHV